MQIASSVFGHNQSIPAKYTCQGDDVNPPLQFFDVPSQAKSLALVMDDPDAPGGTWVHWVVYNIPVTVESVDESAKVQGGIEAITSFGRPGYGGPCPPSGEHRYFFKLYALDTILDLSHNASKAEVENSMEGHILGQAELIGLYQKS